MWYTKESPMNKLLELSQASASSLIKFLTELKGPYPKSSWFVSDKRYECYFRMYPQGFNATSPSVVISNISIREEFQKKGLFKQLVETLKANKDVLGIQHLVVENVLNPHLESYLAREGFVRKEQSFYISL